MPITWAASWPMRNLPFPTRSSGVSKRDADYWLNDANEKAAPAFLNPMFEGAKHVPQAIHCLRAVPALRIRVRSGARNCRTRVPEVRGVASGGFHDPGGWGREA